MSVRELYSASIYIEEDTRILSVKFKNNVEIDVNEMIKLIDVSLEVVANQPFYLLVDARDILSSLDHESRKYFAEHHKYNELNIAQAIVVNNIPIRLLASAYYKLYNHVNPIKVFSNMSDAREWLLKN